ncbi:SRPBCC family protein [Actinomadura fulvescens]|uniref:Coenzyme Q-binding protein COQ10 START domain-containing protein n=1 Tax=Actinomadura fulvescens TaxID=46160 RepID=A0ABP6C0K4_9ACTN
MKLPVGDIAKRLPGRKQSTLSRITKKLPTGALKSLPSGRGKKNLPGGRATGAAGGALVGIGAAVAATRAAGRLKERRDSSPDENSSSAPESSGVEAAKSSKQSSDQPEQGNGDEKKGTLATMLKRGGRDGGGDGGGEGSGGKKVKAINIVEEIDIGAPRRVVYDQWTRFQDFPTFMKKVVSVEQSADEKLAWKAKIFWSSRTWESTIIEQLPDRRIVWRSKARKGHVDGAVTFHRIAPNLTRVLLVLEYQPKGLVERTGNLWRAQGRRARLELKNFRRHVMTRSLLNADDLEGWRGEIRDSEVVMTHEEGLAAEEKARQEGSDQYEETYDKESARESGNASGRARTTAKKAEKKPEKESQTSS